MVSRTDAYTYVLLSESFSAVLLAVMRFGMTAPIFADSTRKKA